MKYGIDYIFKAVNEKNANINSSIENMKKQIEQAEENRQKRIEEVYIRAEALNKLAEVGLYKDRGDYVVGSDMCYGWCDIFVDKTQLTFVRKLLGKPLKYQSKELDTDSLGRKRKEVPIIVSLSIVDIPGITIKYHTTMRPDNSVPKIVNGKKVVCKLAKVITPRKAERRLVCEVVE